MRPRQMSFYKGIRGKYGAIQMSLVLPVYKAENPDGTYTYDPTGELAEENNGRLKEGWIVKNGGVFTEIANPNGSGGYEWDRKMSIFLNHMDISDIIVGAKTANTVKIYHDPNKNRQNEGQEKKSMDLTFPKGPMMGCFINAYYKKYGTEYSYSVPITAPELNLMVSLLSRAQYKIFGW